MIYKINPLIDGEVAENKDELEIDAMYNNKYTDEGIYLKLVKKGTGIPDINNGYCYNYALKLKHTNSCEDGLEILQAIYKRISLKQLKKGDIITYFTDDGEDIHDFNIQHFGIIKKTDNTLKGTIILSKWGLEGVFETNLNSLPEFYGSKICFWRKRR